MRAVRPAAVAILAVAALAAARPAPAATPPVLVVQVKPVGKLLADLRAGAKLVGGESAVRDLNKSIEQTFGDRDLAGVAPDRPVVGYLAFGSKDGGPTVDAVVVAIPVTSEPEFLAFVKRAGGSTVPVDDKPGLFRLTRPNVKPGAEPEFLRFHRGYAYTVQGADSTVADVASLVPPDELVAADEPGMIAVRVRFDRLSAEFRAEFTKGVGKAVEELKGLPVPEGAEGPLKQAAERLQATALRWMSQAPDVQAAVARVLFDARTGEAGLEFALAPKPGTGLARDIAARGPVPSRFAGLIGKDTAVGVAAAAVPVDGFQELFAAAFEDAAKADPGDDVPEAVRPAAAELMRAVGRAFRGGEFGWGLAVNGPDAAGHFTVVAGVAVDDPSKLEQEVRKLVKDGKPDAAAEHTVELDAAKVGGVNVHLIKPDAAGIKEAAKVFGPSARGGITFAPKGIFVAFGPDPVKALGAAVKLEPKPARAFDVAVNPARLAKLAAAADGPGAAKNVADAVGTADETSSAVFATLEGGKELRARFGLSLKLLGKAAFLGANAARPGAAPGKGKDVIPPAPPAKP